MPLQRGLPGRVGPPARPATPYRYRRPASQLASHNQGVNSNRPGQSHPVVDKIATGGPTASSHDCPYPGRLRRETMANVQGNTVIEVCVRVTAATDHRTLTTGRKVPASRATARLAERTRGLSEDASRAARRACGAGGAGPGAPGGRTALSQAACAPTSPPERVQCWSGYGPAASWGSVASHVAVDVSEDRGGHSGAGACAGNQGNRRLLRLRLG